MTLVEDGALLGPRRFDMGNSGVMTDVAILLGALAIGVERWTEVWMNLLRSVWASPPDGQNYRQTLQRAAAILVGIVTGVAITSLTDLDFFNTVFPEAQIKNGVLLSGVVIGLGAAPTHEIVNYIEQKKNKAKEEVKVAKGKASQ